MKSSTTTIVTLLMAFFAGVTPAHAQKSNRYSPAIERAYAARAVMGMVHEVCNDYLTVDLNRVLSLQKEAGLGDQEKPNLETTSRALQAMFKRMAEAGVKRGMKASELELDANKCLVVLHTFGPDGTWIKGLVAEKP